ncbi:MAG: metallophosphoesterase family protein [Phyllobacterium sp.]
MTRIIQISDTHLSPSKSHFVRNWETLAEWVRSEKPDLIIHTGDVTVDGADQEDDMRQSAAMLAQLPAPVLCVPGNHDVGEAHHIHQPVNAERLDRWRRYFGPDWWVRDIEGWRLVGLDSMLFGSNDPEETRQLAWLEEVMEEAGGRHIAWFTHRPLFIEDRLEGDTGYWSVKPEPRARLLRAIDRHKVSLVATGHLHKSHQDRVDGCTYVWGPSSGFVVGPANQPSMPGECRLGAVVYDFGPEGFSLRRSDVPGLETLWIDDVLHEVYPPRPEI